MSTNKIPNELNNELLWILSTIIVLYILVMINIWNIRSLEDRVNIHEIYQTECDEIIQYRRLGRPQFLCYNEGYDWYNRFELAIIERWKTDNQNNNSSNGTNP